MNKDNSNKTVLGIVGAVIGAGVAVAAGKYLSEKKNREKVVDIFSDVKEHFIDPLQGEEEVKDTKPKRKAVRKSASAVKAKRKVSKPNGKKIEEDDSSHVHGTTLKN